MKLHVSYEQLRGSLTRKYLECININILAQEVSIWIPDPNQIVNHLNEELC